MYTTRLITITTVKRLIVHGASRIKEEKVCVIKAVCPSIRITILRIYALYKRLSKYLHNTMWIMAEKFTSLGVGFLISVAVARHLGPEQFGIFSYAISVASLFTAAGHMGLSGLVVREIVKNPREHDAILGTTLGLKFGGMVVG